MTSVIERTPRVERILIAEDSRTQAARIRRIFEDRHYAVEVAENGRLALAAAHANAPDLVISDVNMPEMDGYDLCRALKSITTLKDIPLILVTSLASPNDVIQGLECGADNFIVKPYEEESLVARAKYLLTNRSMRDTRRVHTGIEIDLDGNRHLITAERHQILDLLISTYATAVRLSDDVVARQRLLEASYQTVQTLHRSAEGLNKAQNEAAAAAEILERCVDLPFLREAWVLLVDDTGQVRRCDSIGLREADAVALGTSPSCDCLRDLLAGSLVGSSFLTNCCRLPAARGDGHAAIPLRGHTRSHGLLCVVRGDGDQFAEEEAGILGAMANQFSAALDRVEFNTVLERKVAERTAALKQSHESLARAQRVGAVGSANVDLRTGKTEWSDELYRLLGLDRATTPPTLESYLTVVPPEDRAFIRDKSIQMRNGDQIEPHESRIIRPDGAERWLYRTAEIFSDDAGVPTYASTTFQDITERKQVEENLRREAAERQAAENALAEVVARFERAVRGSSAGIWEINLATQRVYFSPRYMALLGYGEKEAEGNYEEVIAAVHPDDRDRLLEAFRNHIERAAPFDIEYRIRCKDDSYRWVHGVGEATRNSDGKVLILAGSIGDISKRRDAEAKMRRSQEHLNLVQRVAGIGSTEVDLKTQEVIWSNEIFKLFGGDPPHVDLDPGVTSFAEAAHPDDREKLRDASLRGRKGEETEPFEFRIIDRDGSIRWFYRRSEFVRDPDGTPVKLIATIFDITSLKRAERGLRQSLDTLARGQRIGQWGSIHTDFRTNVMQLSDETYRLLDLVPDNDAMSFLKILTVVHPDDREMVAKARDESASDANVEPIEFRIVRRDGEVRWLQREAEVISDEAGQPLQRAVTLHDITARKKMEEALRSSKEHLALAQQVGNIGSCAINMQTGEVHYSDELYRMYGFNPDTAVPTFEAVLALTHPEDREKLAEINARMSSGQDVEPLEFRIVVSDSETRWLLRQAKLIRDAHGQPRTMLITNQDITTHKKNQLKHEQLEEQLRQSQKMEAVGNLTGGIAHDFNNILAVIIGNLDLLRLEIAEGAEARELVDIGISACERGSELTKSLLAFSRRQPLQPKRTVINDLLKDSVKMMRRAIGETVTIQLKLGDGTWSVNVDQSLLESALLNMMVNARDAMANGGVIVVETSNVQLDEHYASSNVEVAPGNYVLLSVSDNGHGMPAEVLERVFEPFFTTKPKGKGTGLGLAMVFGFVKQSDGHIKIYSEVGQGTTIRIYLPRVDSVAAGHSNAVVAGASVRASRGETVLVVEDSPDVRRSVLKQLRGVGYRVLEAENVKDAVLILEQNNEIDLVFSDVIMPGGQTGADLAREIRKRWPAIKIILTSGFPEGLLENGNRLPDGTILLSKPYRMDELFQKLREVLQLTSGQTDG